MRSESDIPSCVRCGHHYMASGKHVCNVNEKRDFDVVTGEEIVNCTWDCYAMRQVSNNQCGYYGKLFVPIKK